MRSSSSPCNCVALTGCTAWIDINLMVTPTSIPLLLRALHLPSPKHTAIRIATADAILETAAKGMPSTDKLALLTILDLGTVLAQLVDVGRVPGVQSTPEIESFREKLAKVLNGVGTELCKIIDEVSSAHFRNFCAC